MQSENKQSAPRGRVMEIEIMKALAIIGMVFVHVFEMCAKVELRSRRQRNGAFLIEFFGGIPSAGVFMFAMGWGAAYSRRATPATYARRALSLFILGIVVNVFEQYIPAVLAPGAFGPLSDVLPGIIATDIYFLRH